MIGAVFNQPVSMTMDSNPQNKSARIKDAKNPAHRGQIPMFRYQITGQMPKIKGRTKALCNCLSFPTSPSEMLTAKANKKRNSAVLKIAINVDFTVNPYCFYSCLAYFRMNLVRGYPTQADVPTYRYGRIAYVVQVLAFHIYWQI